MTEQIEIDIDETITKPKVIEEAKENSSNDIHMEDSNQQKEIKLELDILHPQDQSLLRNQERTNYGDMILIFESRESMKFLILEPGKFFQNKYGAFRHDDIFNQIPGTKIKSMKGDGYITILKFLTHLWERCMNRLTQILFNPDISLIMTFLNLKNDSVIYESGTGSGCLSTNMSQVLSEGHLYTFEFNIERATKLKEVFKSLGLEKTITILNRDVYEKGFEVDEELLRKPEDKKCDGIFIDLPSPWLAVEKAKAVLKTGGSFVSFSPCIEQIDKTMKSLRENGFVNPRMFECMYRNYNYVRNIKVQVPSFSTKRKFGEPIHIEEKDINISNSRNDMRGHTGFLIYALNL
jgi:tRNA (adenine57-N1/adenine58-N1)-methyltransferase catalytic subunit